MFTQTCNRNQRAGRFFARAVVAQATAVITSAVRSAMANAAAMVNSADRFADSLALTTTATFAWNVKPCVHPTAICTHGKPYARRLQEILT